MAAKARSRSVKSGRRTSSARKSRPRKASAGQRAISILQGLLTTVILIGAGILIGSFWGEWRGVRLGAVPTQDPAPRPLAERVKVEILNGSGESGLAQRFSDQLRRSGFDVVALGNADHFDHEVTHVLDRSGRLGAALEVARGLSTDSVAIALDRDLFLDATVVIGRDWRERFAGN